MTRKYEFYVKETNVLSFYSPAERRSNISLVLLSFGEKREGGDEVSREIPTSLDLSDQLDAPQCVSAAKSGCKGGEQKQYQRPRRVRLRAKSSC
jgi:hypothetical protein